MTPYYQDQWTTIFLGDCREILPTLGCEKSDLILAAPPYGVSEQTNRAEKGRARAAACNDFPAVIGDSEPFDPAFLLDYPKVIIWGANYFAGKLPPSATWLVWDKRDGLGSDDNADCEIAWSNLGGPARLYHHTWKGMIKASERGRRRVHPTQKPVELMAWCIQQAKNPQRIIDPFMGGGPVLIAAKRLGIPVIGIEIHEPYCETAAERLRQNPLPFDAGEVA